MGSLELMAKRKEKDPFTEMTPEEVHQELLDRGYTEEQLAKMGERSRNLFHIYPEESERLLKAFKKHPGKTGALLSALAKRLAKRAKKAERGRKKKKDP